MTSTPKGPYPLGSCSITPPSSSKTSWRIRWKTPVGRHVERTATTREAAEKIAAEANANLARPSSGENVTVTYLAQCYMAKLPHGTYHERQEGLLRLWVLPVIGHLHITEWKPSHSRLVMSGIVQAGRGHERVRNAAQAMRALVSYAQDEGWLGKNDDPMWRIRYAPKVAVQGEDAGFVDRLALPTWTDIEALARNAPNPVWALAWRLTARSGVRWGELIALTASDIDMEQRSVSISKSIEQTKNMSRRQKSTKNGKGRLSIFPRSLEDDVAERISVLAPNDLLFPGPDGGFAERTWHRRFWIKSALAAKWPFDPEVLEDKWPRPPWSIHDFRHFAACWMLYDLKASPVHAAAWMGHSSPAFTLARYAGMRGDLIAAGKDLTADV
jgi:integrase